MKGIGDHSSRDRIAPFLKQPTRAISVETDLAVETARRPYSVLLPVGFTVPPCVAADAVRSYRTLSISRGRNLRDLLSVALSLGSLQPVVNRHRHFVEPGLSSPWKLPATPRPPGPLAGWALDRFSGPVIPLIRPRVVWGAARPAGWRDIRRKSPRRSAPAGNGAGTRPPPPWNRQYHSRTVRAPA